MILDKEWREERKARKIGVRDGRAGIPSEDWSGGPVPYLREVHARYALILQGLHLSATSMIGQSVHVDHKFEARTKELTTDLIRHTADADSLAVQMDHALKERDGLSKEAPEGKIARRRGIPTWLYLVCLFALVIGEFLVTVPAVVQVFNEESLKAYMVAASISALSVTLAHLFGISLKERLDRNTPQPVSILWGFGGLAVVFMITLLFLSALRAGMVQSQVTLGLSQKAFGTTLFFVLQLTFIGAATGLAFYNHSELDSRIRSLAKKLRSKNRKVAKIRKEMAKSPANRMNENKVQVQATALRQEYEAVMARYNIVVAIYCRFNILNQRNKLDELNEGLQAPALLAFDENIAIKSPDTQFDKYDNIEEELPYKPIVPDHFKPDFNNDVEDDDTDNGDESTSGEDK